MDEILRQLKVISDRLDKIEAFQDSLGNDTTIPFEVASAFGARFSKEKLAKVTAPSGGATVDSNARTAINSVISRLESAGIIEEN